jgi:hypothetical protein
MRDGQRKQLEVRLGTLPTNEERPQASVSVPDSSALGSRSHRCLRSSGPDSPSPRTSLRVWWWLVWCLEAPLPRQV